MSSPAAPLSAVHHDAESIVTDRRLGYDQKVRRLAALATTVLPAPALGADAQEALDKRVVCDMYEGNRPFTPRYVLPDYAAALRTGVRHLELDPPRDLEDALSFLTILYGHVPSVTTYPVYLGDLDALLEPYVPPDLPDDRLDRILRRFWVQLDRLLPDAFVHTDLGPRDGRVVRSILRVERSLRQVVPNITLKVDPGVTPDDLVLDAVRTVFVTGKPHFVNHPMMVTDHGEGYAAVSCYNSLRIGGGAHTLVRLNLKEAALRCPGGVDTFLADELPRWVELTSQVIEARVRSLVEEQGFFESHFLATEGLVHLDRFSAMFGVFGLAECVATLLGHGRPGAHDDHGRPGAHDDHGRPGARYGHDPEANEAAYRIVARVAELVAARPLPYCAAGAGAAFLHSQGGIDLDEGVTAGTRIPVGDEPDLRAHLTVCAPLHRHFPAGISDIVHVDDTAVRNPQAMVDIIRGAFAVGMREFTFNLDSNEFVRITGYLVRKSDLAAVDEHGARHASDYLAAGSERSFHVTGRAVSRVGCHELAARPGR